MIEGGDQHPDASITNANQTKLEIKIRVEEDATSDRDLKYVRLLELPIIVYFLKTKKKMLISVHLYCYFTSKGH